MSNRQHKHYKGGRVHAGPHARAARADLEARRAAQAANRLAARRPREIEVGEWRTLAEAVAEDLEP